MVLPPVEGLFAVLVAKEARPVRGVYVTEPSAPTTPGEIPAIFAPSDPRVGEAVCGGLVLPPVEGLFAVLVAKEARPVRGVYVIDPSAPTTPGEIPAIFTLSDPRVGEAVCEGLLPGLTDSGTSAVVE
jgi:hypothetical protein